MKENILRLIIAEDSSNDAEVIINNMQRAGYGVRAVRVNNYDTMQAALTEQIPDVILCTSNLVDFSVQQALALVKKTGKDVSFIVLSNGPSADASAVAFINAGARDVISKNHAELLQLVIAREFSDLDERRSHRHCLKVLRETEKRCRSLIDSSRDAIAYVHDGMHIYANATYLRMFGYQSAEELEGTPIMDMVAPVDHARFKDFLRTYALAEEKSKELEVSGLHTDKSTFSALMKFSAASIEDEACTQIIIQDLSQNQELENKIKLLSQKDLLTGLYNRQYFLKELDATMAKAANGIANSILIYVQLDNFLTLQESIGIAAIDMVLRDIATLLKGQVEESITLAHFSNDVFAMLVHDKTLDDAQQIAEKLRKAVESNVYDAAGQTVTATCRIVVALIAEYILNSKVLLSEVDKLSRQERSVGENKVHLYSPDTEVRSAKSKLQEQITRIQSALASDRFRMVYQPIVSLHGVPGENYQVFVRMLDESGNEVAPDAFIPAAEQVGLTVAIDRWVIAHAIQTLAAKRRSGSKLTFFIKLFEHTIKDESLLLWVSELIKVARLEGDSLVFELSELSAVTHVQETQAFINGLKELHCRFCLEHFGCSPNSLAQLKHLPSEIDYLTIDRSFQISLSTNTENQAAVKSIIETARLLGITTIAEGVEDAGSLAMLWQYGVNYVQGYYLQKPSEALNYDFSESV